MAVRIVTCFRKRRGKFKQGHEGNSLKAYVGSILYNTNKYAELHSTWETSYAIHTTKYA